MGESDLFSINAQPESEEQAAQMRQHHLQGGYELIGGAVMGFVGESTAEMFPFMWTNAQGAAVVAAASRNHGETERDIQAEWTGLHFDAPYTTALAILNIRFPNTTLDPLKVWIDVYKHRALLEQILRYGRLMIFSYKPPREVLADPARLGDIPGLTCTFTGDLVLIRRLLAQS